MNKKMSKSEFVTTYMRRIDVLRALEVTEGMINFFSSIYDEYLKMYEKGRVDEKKLIESFHNKGIDLLNYDTEKVLKSHLSIEEAMAIIKINYDVYSWNENTNIDIKIEILKNIYKDLSKHTKNDKVIRAFPEFDTFVYLYEKYSISDTALKVILNNINDLDFSKINKNITYFYVELYQEELTEKSNISQKIAELKGKNSAYKRAGEITTYEEKYQEILPNITELQTKLKALTEEKESKIINKNSLEEQLKQLKGEKDSLSKGITKFLNKKKSEAITNQIEQIKAKLKQIEEEIASLNEQIEAVAKEKDGIENEFYMDTFVKFEDFPLELESSKNKLDEEFQNYDENQVIQEIAVLNAKLIKIEAYLSVFTKKDTNGKKIS